MSRPTKEREQEIRKQQEGPDGCLEVEELLAAIDALRADLLDAQASQVGIIERGTITLDSWSLYLQTKSERDQLKAENEALSRDFWSSESHVKELEEENQKLHDRVEKLRNALTSIAALHLEPFAPELLDSTYEVVLEDTKIAREALTQDDELEKQK